MGHLLQRRRFDVTLLLYCMVTCLSDAFLLPNHGVNGVRRRRVQRPPQSFVADNVKNDNRIILHLVATDPDIAMTATETLSNYAPAATSLFNNMKLPAAVVTAGMISLGFATSFPELPPDTSDRKYTEALRKRCESLRRLHAVVAMISVTSELIVVMWSAVEVNQLTERVFAPTPSVWDLIQRDCDLAWSAVNSHFVLGIIGFVSMLSFRGYVMLIAAEASSTLISAAMSGTAAALCLMISVVNRGVEAGGGDGIGYGRTIVDLLAHYISLLYESATDPNSPGLLQLMAILFELASVFFALKAILTGDEKETMAMAVATQMQPPPEVGQDRNNVGSEGDSLPQFAAKVNYTQSIMGPKTESFDGVPSKKKDEKTKPGTTSQPTTAVAPLRADGRSVHERKISPLHLDDSSLIPPAHTKIMSDIIASSSSSSSPLEMRDTNGSSTPLESGDNSAGTVFDG